MKILTVDDDSTSRLVLAATLKKLGHEVTSAASAEEVLTVFRKGHVPLLISDMGMRAGADDFLPKPVDEEVLATRLAVAERILGLQSQVKQLVGLLPICAVCKKVRDDQNYWQQVEAYIGKRTDARFTHSYCPDCF